MGQVISGWCRYELAEGVEPATGPLELIARHGEKLRADGTVDDENIHIWTDRFQQDRVRLEPGFARGFEPRSEEHTSELQSRGHLVCRLLLAKNKGCDAP